MARVVVVHGIGQQFSGPESMGLAVRAALCDGVRNAGGDPESVGEIGCAFYGDVFLAPGSRALDLPPWDETDVEPGLEAELLEAWWRAAAAYEPGQVQGPDAREQRGVLSYGASRVLVARRVREALDALSGSLFFAHVSDRLLIFALKQVRTYLTDPQVRAAARARIAAQITSDTRVLVSHSLGSVVAYEALCANPGWPVTTLVTLGSPLGMRSIVFDRLDPSPRGGRAAWPGSVARWSNIADPGDVVALPHKLAPRFGPGRVVDSEITNGARMHDLARYLTAPKTGAAITQGMRRR